MTNIATLDRLTDWQRVCASLGFTFWLVGCDPVALQKQITAEALSAVSSHIDATSPVPNGLRVSPNPWGIGVVVFNAGAASPDQALIWFYLPDLHWSIPATPKRDALFAFDARASKLTPAVPLIDAANDDQREKVGVEAASREEIVETILLHAKNVEDIREARAAVLRRMSIGK